MSGPHLDKWSIAILNAADELRSIGIANALIFKKYSVKFVGTFDKGLHNKHDNDNDRFPVNMG